MVTITLSSGKSYNVGVYDIKPVYTPQKSFYGKAFGVAAVNEDTLYSYQTKVCKICNGNFVRLWSGYSKTTMIHINEFRMQNRLPSLSKKEWNNLPVER